MESLRNLTANLGNASQIKLWKPFPTSEYSWRRPTQSSNVKQSEREAEFPKPPTMKSTCEIAITITLARYNKYVRAMRNRAKEQASLLATPPQLPRAATATFRIGANNTNVTMWQSGSIANNPVAPHTSKPDDGDVDGPQLMARAGGMTMPQAPQRKKSQHRNPACRTFMFDAHKGPDRMLAI
jgi:hypothetical protein